MASSNSEYLVRNKAKELFPDSPTDQAYFLGLAKQESHFDPKAYNARGDAYGLFQFSGGLRKAYGLDLNSPPEKQVESGGQYIKQLHTKHKGNWMRVLAEHYMGIPRLRKADQGIEDPEVKSFYTSHLPKVKKYAAQYGAPQGEFTESRPSPRRVKNQGTVPDSAETARTIRRSQSPGLASLVASYVPDMETAFSPIKETYNKMSEELNQIANSFNWK